MWNVWLQVFIFEKWRTYPLEHYCTQNNTTTLHPRLSRQRYGVNKYTSSPPTNPIWFLLCCKTKKKSRKEGATCRSQQDRRRSSAVSSYLKKQQLVASHIIDRHRIVCSSRSYNSGGNGGYTAFAIFAVHGVFCTRHHHQYHRDTVSVDCCLVATPSRRRFFKIRIQQR